MRKRRIRLTEGEIHRMVKNSMKKVINELNLGGGEIDFSDWHITELKPNDDGYYEFEARCDNDWYTVRGTYGYGEIELDFLMRGHSGYGRQIPITDKLQRWFDINASDTLRQEIERRIENDDVDEPYDYDEY